MKRDVSPHPKQMSSDSTLPDELLNELRAVIGERLVISRAVREHHGHDESPLPPALPDAVAFPESTEEVAALLEVCGRWRVPVVPFGGGSSLEGHVLAVHGGLCLDVTGMNEIVSTNVSDLDVTVEAGVTRTQLEEHLRREGLFFPVDPGADATIGGMTATGASGTTTVMYGAMRENVLSLEVVLPDGRIISTGQRARKTSAGYDLTRLFVGSEGTLGVITKVRLRVYGLPEAISAAVCHFPGVNEAIQTVITTLQMGVPVARIEFLDEMAMKAVSQFSGLSYQIAPTLFMEFHGSPAGVAEHAQSAGDIAAEWGAVEFRSAVELEERLTLWSARHDAFFASLALRPGSCAITTDVCVPISRLAECIVETRKDVEELGLTATTVGHVGDGNFHVMLMFDPNDDQEVRAAAEVNRCLVDRALEMDGTCTGEHGVGMRKMSSLAKELGEAVDVMRAVKRAVDPLNIMNPGKVFTADGSGRG
jgi:D-lactate dehydrogenase (cytochrome)